MNSLIQVSNWHMCFSKLYLGLLRLLLVVLLGREGPCLPARLAPAQHCPVWRRAGSAQIQLSVPAPCSLYTSTPDSSVRQGFATLPSPFPDSAPTLAQAVEKWPRGWLLNSYVFPPRQESSVRLYFCTVRIWIFLLNSTGKKKDCEILISEAANVYSHEGSLTYF